MNKIKNALRKLPSSPGVYQFLDAAGEIIYIGKAKVLKNRVKSYFQKNSKSPKIEKLVELATDLNWLETNSESEALTLEANLVKEFQPKFNALLRDDKHFLYFKITKEDFPQVLAVRKIEPDGARYFGPKTDSKSVRETIQLVQKLFRIRTCNLGLRAKNSAVEVYKKTLKYPCLFAHINFCAAPCDSQISVAAYQNLVAEAADFLAGSSGKILQNLRAKMVSAAAEKKFELAGQLRDQITAIENSSARQLASATDLTSRDVVGVKIDFKKAYFALLQIRNGKLVDAKNFVFAVGESELPEILESFLTQFFAISTEIPPEVLLPDKIENAASLENWLTEMAQKKVRVLFPQKGLKNNLLQLAEKNAAAFAVQNKAKFENATERTIGAAAELARSLGIQNELKRIEAYDISHFSGDATVGSMVVFAQGEPKNSDYRHFKIRSLVKGEVDDFASLAEVLSRRMDYLVSQNSKLKIRKASPKQILATKLELQKNSEIFVALDNQKVVGGFRIIHQDKKHVLLDAIFGENLTEIFLKFALKKFPGKLYFAGEPEICESLGFREVQKRPDFCFSADRIFVAEAKNSADSSFAIRPDLVVIDGGKGQLSTVLKKVRFPKNVEVIGLAKREEEIWRRRDAKFERILLPRDSQALYLLQRIRDEAHRFANALREKLQNSWKK
ncbi:MAG: excinuclease ABC subunit UvrC [Patescibacteria group bacterium]